MIFVHRKIYIVFAAIIFMLLSIEKTQASDYVYGVNTTFNSSSLTQRHEDLRQFEFTASQARSRVGHTLVNYLLGQTVDQYLELGDNDTDTVNRKTFKSLRLRLNRHRALLFYQYTFY